MPLTKKGYPWCLAIALAFAAIHPTVAQEKVQSDLDELTSTTEARPGERVLVVVARRGPISHLPVTLVVAPPATVSPTGKSGSCSASPGGSSLLVWPASQSDVATFCVSTARGAKVRLLASAAGTNGVVQSAQSDVIQFNETSIGSNPVWMALLTAGIGFVFGLGSAWFSAFTESYRNRAKARTEAQKFIAETFFPELRAHARSIAQYRAATPRVRQDLSVNSLPLPAAALAYSDEHFSNLTAYFSSLRLRGLPGRLERYDGLVQRFNDEANLLLSQAPPFRNTGPQEQAAAELYQALTELGFL